MSSAAIFAWRFKGQHRNVIMKTIFAHNICFKIIEELVEFHKTHGSSKKKKKKKIKNFVITLPVYLLQS